MGEVKAKEVVWCGNLSGGCDICHRQFEYAMYDCKTDKGPWGNLCDSCYGVHGLGLGTGLGQKYERRETDGKYVKVAG